MFLSSFVPPLPVELHLIILEFLRNDRETLVACSLVCKLWSTRCQPLLFKVVRITPQNAISFCDTLASRPELADHIVQVTLGHIESSLQPPHTFSLKGIRDLCLTGGGLRDPWVCAVLATNESSVEQIAADNCCLDEVADLLKFIDKKQYPKLKALHISHSRVRHLGLRDGHAIAEPDIALLSLGPSVTGPSGYGAGTSASTRSYRDLSVLKLRLVRGIMCVTTMAGFRQLLEHLGPNLRKLDIGFGNVEGNVASPGAWQRIGLPFDSCVNLREVTLEHAIGDRRSFGYVSILGLAPVFLDTLRSQKLRHIRLVVGHSFLVKCKETTVWRRIDHVLTDARFASLRRVEVCLVDYRSQILVPWVKARLPALDARGILDVVLGARRQPWVDGLATMS